MKIAALVILQRPQVEGTGLDPDTVNVLKHFEKIDGVPFWEKRKVVELLVQGCRMICARTAVGSMKSVNYPETRHIFHLRITGAGKCGVVVTDAEYPGRAAIAVASKLVQATPEECNLKEMLQTYQDPTQADRLTQIQRELDQVMEVMQENIEKILQRGEQIDHLVQRSRNLSDASKSFYKTAKKMNRCCTVL